MRNVLSSYIALSIIVILSGCGTGTRTTVQAPDSIYAMSLEILKIQGFNASEMNRDTKVKYLEGFTSFYPIVKCTVSGRYRVFLGINKEGTVMNVQFMDGEGFDHLKGMKARRCVFRASQNLQFHKLQVERSVEVEVTISNDLTTDDVEYAIQAPLTVPQFLVKNNGGHWCGEGVLSEHRHLWGPPNCTQEEGVDVCHTGCITFDRSPSQEEWETGYRLSILSIRSFIAYTRLRGVLPE